MFWIFGSQTQQGSFSFFDEPSQNYRRPRRASENASSELPPRNYLGGLIVVAVLLWLFRDRLHPFMVWAHRTVREAAPPFATTWGHTWQPFPAPVHETQKQPASAVSVHALPQEVFASEADLMEWSAKNLKSELSRLYACITHAFVCTHVQIAHEGGRWSGGALALLLRPKRARHARCCAQGSPSKKLSWSMRYRRILPTGCLRHRCFAGDSLQGWWFRHNMLHLSRRVRYRCRPVCEYYVCSMWT